MLSKILLIILIKIIYTLSYALSRSYLRSQVSYIFSSNDISNNLISNKFTSNIESLKQSSIQYSNNFISNKFTSNIQSSKEYSYKYSNINSYTYRYSYSSKNPTTYPTISSKTNLPTQYPTQKQIPILKPSSNPIYVPTSSPSSNPSSIPTSSPVFLQKNNTYMPSMLPIISTTCPTNYRNTCPSINIINSSYVPTYSITIRPSSRKIIKPTLKPTVQPIINKNSSILYFNYNIISNLIENMTIYDIELLIKTSSYFLNITENYIYYIGNNIFLDDEIKHNSTNENKKIKLENVYMKNIFGVNITLNNITKPLEYYDKIINNLKISILNNDFNNYLKNISNEMSITTFNNFYIIGIEINKLNIIQQKNKQENNSTFYPTTTFYPSQYNENKNKNDYMNEEDILMKIVFPSIMSVCFMIIFAKKIINKICIQNDTNKIHSDENINKSDKNDEPYTIINPKIYTKIIPSEIDDMEKN